MRRTAILFSIVVLLTPVTAWTQDTELVVVPAVAYQFPGFDENLWTSEVYFSNSADVPGKVRPLRVLPGVTVPPDGWSNCGWEGQWTRYPAPHSSMTHVVGSNCLVEEAVGAYIFEVSRDITVSARMVNHSPDRNDHFEPFLSGFGSEIPGIPLDELPQAGAYLLPALIWHPDRCGPRTFETYAGFANPYDVEVNVTIDLAGDSADPSNAYFPQDLTVPALSWRQISIRPPTSDSDS